MVYLKRFVLPSEKAEIGVISAETRTCFGTFYPFKIFPDKQLKALDFDNITLLYGGNGSGKSTLINVIAQKINAVRYSDFNDSPLFDTFLELCNEVYAKSPRGVCALTSDDVFDYALSARCVNGRIDKRRNELFDKYVKTHAEAITDPSIGLLKGLEDYGRWSETREILSKRRTQSSYVKKRVAPDVDLCSNGETALRYFIDRIDGCDLYLLDEPENSLSIELQLKLSEYIEATAIAERSQFIIATHSPVLLSMRGAKIYNLDAYPVCTCRWTELPNVRRYYDFFIERKEEFE